ncbi:hypothetical protein GE061_015375 [Apolygus lucorum]|uniref:N-acetylgalactosaminide beta-1,3-galactosyltransferase n=1 Tax=Apolygus lucorum TaxID=248454 RepID=A0A6A4J9N9_APOLU|nr:hypothetical protein GE061_015375 [Apolygus lucorum]
MICYSGLVFSIGFCVGMFLALMSSDIQTRPGVVDFVTNTRFVSSKDFYGVWLEQQGISREKLDLDRFSFDPNFKKRSVFLESEYLTTAVNVACAVFTVKVRNSYTVASSWGSKCNSVQFYSDKVDDYLKTVQIRGKPNTWEFLCLTILDLATHVSAGWYVFAKDDVYFIPENFRYIVATRDPSKPYYMGRNALFWGTLYNTGKTAFVLSRGALELIYNKYNSSFACKQSSMYRNNEDYLLGKYLAELGVMAEDSRDESGRERFHVFTPEHLLAPGYNWIFQKYFSRSLNPTIQGKPGFSPTSVSFHGVQQDYIFLYEFLLYHVKVFNYNGGYGNNRSRVYKPSDNVWKAFVRESLGPDYNVSKVSAQDYFKLWDLWDPPEEFVRSVHPRQKSRSP